jgi:hypothetical protein
MMALRDLEEVFGPTSSEPTWRRQFDPAIRPHAIRFLDANSYPAREERS